MKYATIGALLVASWMLLWVLYTLVWTLVWYIVPVGFAALVIWLVVFGVRRAYRAAFR